MVAEHRNRSACGRSRALAGNSPTTESGRYYWEQLGRDQRAEKGAERSFRYGRSQAGSKLCAKTLSQHEIATVQTTSIDEAAGIGARHRSRQINRIKPRHVVRLTYHG